MLAAQFGDLPGEREQVDVDLRPVDPGDLVVLAVAVVVAALGASQLVAVADHRHALRDEHRGDEVALLLCAQRQHLRVVGRALDAAVPRAVVALAVVVVVLVVLVVLLVVGDEVAQREPVVRGDEVDARDRTPTGGLVQVGRAGDARRELTDRRGLAAPEVAHGVAVLAVPLRPLRREVADLVAARPDVPRLGDQLHLADDRILLHEFEERRQPVDVVELARQGRREVEAEPVDVHLGDPVPQRVHDQLQRVRMAHVERVARAGVVHVVLRRVVDEPVVGRVVDAAERQRRAEVVALAGVVVDHVEDDFDAGVVQRAHHRLELLHLATGVAARGVLRVGREEPDRVVAPVVRQALVDEERVVGEVVDGHQLERRDAERGQVVDHHRVRHAGVRAAHLLGDLGVQLGHALDVRLVDHRLGVGQARRAVVGPVEERADHDALGHVTGRVVVVDAVRVVEVVAEQRLVPLDGAVDRLRVRVEQQLVRVAAQPVRRVVRAVHAVAVALARLDAGQERVPDEPVDLGQLEPRLVPVGREQAQLDAFGDLAEQREIGARTVVGRTERICRARPDLHVVPFPTTAHSCLPSSGGSGGADYECDGAGDALTDEGDCTGTYVP